MAAAGMKYRELRFVIEDELTQVYVLIEALGDCPMGVQGWHHKTFPASKPVIDILTRLGRDNDAVLWPQQAPQ